MKKITTLLICISITISGFAQLMTNTITNIQQTVLNSLVANGINVTNISYTGHTNAIGEFTCNGCSVSIPSGVVLTTGTIVNIGQPASSFITADNSAPGDADLNSLNIGNTLNASVLEFDYQVVTDTIEITFVFASEEYNEYVNSPFNDIFAFFVSGPGINNDNIALIPGTIVPVAINNVNNGNSSGLSTGPCTNCQFYIDNTSVTTVAYDGMTTVITAKRVATPGAVYHMKLAIADVTDGIFDSGVFIAGNSIGARGTAPIYIDGNRIAQTTTINKCDTEVITITAPPGGTYLWSTGETTQSIDAIQDGVYKLNLSYGGNATAESDSVIVINSYISPVQPVITVNAGVLESSSTTGNQWYLNGQMIPGATTQTLIPSGAGNYTVQVTDATTGCVSGMSAPHIITSINEISESDLFNIYVNHLDSEIIINSEYSNVELIIYNSIGAKIIDTVIPAGDSKIELPANGIYFVNLIRGNKKLTEKIVY